MHQAAARYWNEIAETQPLKTEWAQQMFPLLQEDMDLALENEEKRLFRETNNPRVASAYLKIMPLLWENRAISNYLKDNPSLRGAATDREPGGGTDDRGGGLPLDDAGANETWRNA